MYLPWIGFSFAIGASFDLMTHLIRRNRQVIRFGISLLLVAFVTYQSAQIRHVYRQIQNHIEIMESVRQQLMELKPTPANDTHFFVYDLPSTNDFFQAMASVWYDRSFPAPGGSFGRLKSKGNADSNYYLFNFQDGVFYNLMPELQEEGETTFLWASPMAAQILHPDGSMNQLDSGSYKVNLDVGPPDARRLGIFLHPPSPNEGWSSIKFQATIPEHSDLRFGILRESGGLPEEDGMTFRVRAIRPSGESTVLFIAFLEPDQTKTKSQWTDVSLPMGDYWGETIDLYLEVFAGNNLLHDHGFWANPRFVVDNSAQ